MVSVWDDNKDAAKPATRRKYGLSSAQYQSQEVVGRFQANIREKVAWMDIESIERMNIGLTKAIQESVTELKHETKRRTATSAKTHRSRLQKSIRNAWAAYKATRSQALLTSVRKWKIMLTSILNKEKTEKWHRTCTVIGNMEKSGQLLKMCSKLRR